MIYRPAYYRLDGKRPVLCRDVIEWAMWFEGADRHVGKDHIGPMFVSTVFLGLDHSFGRGRPLFFETMILGLVDDEYQERCSTWEEAELQHAEAVAIAEKRLAAALEMLATSPP